MSASTAAALAARVATWLLALAVLLAVGLPPIHGHVTAGRFAIPLGLGAGILLFAALAGGYFPRPSLSRGRSAVAAAVAVVVARAAFEEAVWRGLVFGLVAKRTGAATALAASTLAFAASHWRPQRWRMLVHLVTGATFAGVYLATGDLGGAVAAHGTYNTLVVLALTSSSEVRPPAEERTTVALASKLVKRYGATEAVRGVSLRLAEGELLGLLGPNGAGKTTLLSLLLGLRRPDEGSARLFGLDPRDPSARASIGVTPQETGFPPTLRVGEVIDLVRAHYANPVPKDELVRRFGLAGVAGRQTGGLSGGERRRLAVALAFAGRPRAVFLDEPTTGLDVESRQAVWREIRDYVRAGGAALLTSHQLDEVEALAGRVVVMRRGELVAEGPVAEIKLRAGLTRVRLDASSLPDLPGVERVAREGASLVLYTAESDALVRALVGSGAPFANLEVSRPTLEDAFLGLTGDHG